mgnify:CR=1 FL=1
MNQSILLLVLLVSSLSACRSIRCNKYTQVTAEDPVFESALEGRSKWTSAWTADRTNCENPLTEATFKNLITFLEKETDKTKRLNYSKEALEKSCMTSYQLSRMAKLFVLESDKLSLAKYAYGKVYDPQNYHWILDQLVLLSSQEEINKLIEAKLD